MNLIRMTVEGTVWAAWAISHLLRSEIESGTARVNYGSWTTPIIVETDTETANALESILLEAGCKWVRKD